MYLIFGTGRCGTSRVARILEERFGIDFGGPGETSGAHPEGTYEWQAHRVIDTAFMLGDITIQQWALAIRRFTETLTEPYGLRHPLNAPFVQLYVCMFPEAKLIWCQRDLTETIADYYQTHDVEDVVAAKAVLGRFDALCQTLLKLPHVAVDVSKLDTDDEIADYLAAALDLVPKLAVVGA